ncbi:hypothetical protein GWI33_007900, partial [Rhynchophorus ferrugineus]
GHGNRNSKSKSQPRIPNLLNDKNDKNKSVVSLVSASTTTSPTTRWGRNDGSRKNAIPFPVDAGAPSSVDTPAPHSPLLPRLPLSLAPPPRLDVGDDDDDDGRP